MRNDVERLRKALLNRNPREMQLSIASFPVAGEGEKEARQLLDEEMPEDIRSWWIDDVCDAPHGLVPETEEILSLAHDLIKEGHSGPSTSTKEA